MEKIRENLSIIPWLVNSNLHKMDVIVSHIDPTALELSKKKFKKSMEEKSNALVSRARKEVRSYMKVAEADQHKIYRKLTKLRKKLRKICLQLQRTHKLVKRLLIIHPGPSQAMMLAMKILLKADIMVDVMMDYIKQFRVYVKGLAKDVKNNPKMNSVAPRSDFIAAKRFQTQRRCNISLEFDDTLDQDSAADLVKAALRFGFPVENLFIPEAVRVRVADDGSVEMY
ncbi:uncharacterized protein LOC141597102 [Silene latifolia]|uniref:uncharacterized protein LOC141597102 n=1 Tax=Silene latifolia TaxID=37657 RepID=UPI003D776C7D